MSLPPSRRPQHILLTLACFCSLLGQAASGGRGGPKLSQGETEKSRILREWNPWTGGVVLPLELGNTNTPNLQLYYTMIEIGTPPQYLKVACDTGSNLLWVNCECASASLPPALNEWDEPPPNNGEGGEESGCARSSTSFDSRRSSTLVRPACADPICRLDPSTTCDPALTDQVCSSVLYSPSFCAAADVNATCPYLLSYSDDSYSTGVILTDMLSIPGLAGDSVRVPFGCGQSQGGHLWSDAAFGQFSGLMGLGHRNSAIKLLAEAGAERDVFSLCLGGESGGSVLVIGDVRKPPEGRVTTPVLPSLSEDESLFTATLEGVQVGSSRGHGEPSEIQIGKMTAAIDSGATYTVLPDSIFAAFTEALIRSMPLSLSRAYPDSLDVIGPSKPPCWNPRGLTTEELTAAIPAVSLMFGGGAKMDIPPPNLMRFVPMSEHDQTVAVCAMVISGGPYNTTSLVLGENWLRNLFLTFDRAQGTLSWAPVDCLTGNANVSRVLRPGKANSDSQGGGVAFILGGVNPRFSLILILVLSTLGTVWAIHHLYSTTHQEDHRKMSI